MPPKKKRNRNRARNNLPWLKEVEETIPTRVYCSGVSPPAYLSTEKGYEYPLQEKRTLACAECPHCMCYGPPSDMRDPNELANWFLQGCEISNCDSAEFVYALADDINELPRNVVVCPKRGDANVDGVYAFLPDKDGRKIVTVFDVTLFPLGTNKRVFQLPGVVAASRRMVFGKLTDAIEASASALTDAQYKALYDAAKAAHDAGRLS